MSNSLVTCECGWVSFAITKEKAEAEIAAYNNYIESLKGSLSGGAQPSSLDLYTCTKCGGDEFRPTQEDEVPYGCTINPVIWEGKEDAG